jgi:DNA-binding CsgD family transcriptional regulator
VARLSERDFRQALSVLHAAGEVGDENPFPEPVLEALRNLVPSDVVAYHEHPVGHPAVCFAGEPAGEMTPAIREAFVRHTGEDPLRPAEGARTYSDYLSRREYHRLGLYQEIARPLGVDDMMRLWLDKPYARLEFDRADWGFSKRDRVVLDLLLPHLRQLRRNVRRRRPVSSSSSAACLTPREREIVGLVAEGMTNAEVARILWISPGTVRKHLENAYDKLGVRTRAGAVAALLRHA